MAIKFLTSIRARFFNSPSTTAVDIGIDGDTNPRIAIEAGGRISWSDGSSSADSSLFRSSTNHLKTPGSFEASKLIVNNLAELNSNNISLANTDPNQTIDISSGKSVKYIIHAEDELNYEVTEILAVKNSSNLNYVEYGKISTNGNDLVLYDVILSSENFYLKATPSVSDMNFTIIKTIIT